MKRVGLTIKSFSYLCCVKYYITTTANAEQISRDKAIEKGCGPVTKYWWAWIVDDRDADQSALCFEDDESVSYTTVDTLPDGFLPADPGA
jgi:hypothetical protein